MQGEVWDTVNPILVFVRKHILRGVSFYPLTLAGASHRPPKGARFFQSISMLSMSLNQTVALK